MRVTRDAAAALDAGFTSVREVGGLGIWLATAVAEGSVSGPTVYAAGAVLSPTGGQADLHMYPSHWACDLAARLGSLRQGDGAAGSPPAGRPQRATAGPPSNGGRPT